MFTTHRLVKSEDLNHHGTLFAGRGAEWFVEAGFIAATKYIAPHEMICLKIHGMKFSRPVKAGEIIVYQSKIVHVGKSSLTAYVKVTYSHQSFLIVDGFITFVHVDENTRPKPHGINIVLENEYEKTLQEQAKEILKQK